ncbi:MAG: TOBE domain-containing protein, partial [Acidimicrobiales bacterium]|nr:TOBE domain-containing protein [Acidimicrobiales bacterium]
VEAMTMGHRIAIMEGGVLQQVAAPDEVYARPANTFVAGFIGNPPMNLLDGEARAGGGAGATVTVGDLAVPIAAELAERVGDDAEVVLGIRPEHVHLDDASPLRAEVAVVEELGHERHVVCRSDDGTLVTVREAVDDTRPDRELAVGEAVGLAVDAGAVHLFRRADGERIGP